MPVDKQNRSTEGCSRLKRSVDMTSSGKNGLNIRTNASPKMGQDQVSGGVSVLCWLAAPVAMFYGNLQNLVIRSKSVIKSSSVICNFFINGILSLLFYSVQSLYWAIEERIYFIAILRIHESHGLLVVVLHTMWLKCQGFDLNEVHV